MRSRRVELILAPRVLAAVCLAAAAISTTVIAQPLPAEPATTASGVASDASASGVVSDASAIETLRTCGGKLLPLVRGLDGLAAECPDLKSALAALGYFKTLPAGWESGLNTAQLQDLAALASRYRGEPPSTAPDVGAVRRILDALAKERTTAPKSWWEVLRDWVKSLFASHEDSDHSWIERLMNKLSGAAGVLNVLTYGLVALVIGVALTYAVIEMRSWGIFARTARSRKIAKGARVADAEPAEEELAHAPIFDQPALLLVLLVRRLKRVGRLSAERHLTHRELARAAVLDDAAQRNRLGHLTEVAEHLLYGASPPSGEIVHRAVEEGRELLRQLDGARKMSS
jgi:hypothetical protein